MVVPISKLLSELAPYVETCCCFPSAVATNRFMIQDEMRVMNTQCDNCLIGFMLLMVRRCRLTPPSG